VRPGARIEYSLKGAMQVVDESSTVNEYKEKRE
jgi:hypothetical protein